jgi:hypothetical protein
MSIDHDGLISHLIEITGCETDVARHILEATHWDLSAAFTYLRDDPGDVVDERPTRGVRLQLPDDEFQVQPGSNIDVSSTSSKFRSARSRAERARRWLLVYLTEVPLGLHSVVNSPVVKDLIATHFVKFECSFFDPEGEWFVQNYGIQSAPCFTIIDPTTGETTAQQEVAMDPTMLYDWLRDYVADRTPAPVPAKEAPEVGSAEKKEEEVENKGKTVNITVEFPGDNATKMRRVRVEIGENERVGTMYKKVASLIGRKDSDFKLVLALANLTEMTDRKKTVAEMDCAKTLVRVMFNED